MLGAELRNRDSVINESVTVVQYFLHYSSQGINYHRATIGNIGHYAVELTVGTVSPELKSAFACPHDWTATTAPAAT